MAVLQDRLENENSLPRFTFLQHEEEMARKTQELEEKKKKEEEERRMRIERGLETESENGDGKLCSWLCECEEFKLLKQAQGAPYPIL